MGNVVGIDETLAASVAAIRALYGAAACSVALVAGEGEVLRYASADGAGAERIVGVELPVSRGVAGWVAMSGQPIAVRDVGSDARFARDVAEATDFVPASILAAPMFDAAGETLGVVSVLDPAIEASPDWTLAVLGTVAAQVALLVQAHAVRSEDDPEQRRWAELGRRVLAVVEEQAPRGPR